MTDPYIEFSQEIDRDIDARMKNMINRTVERIDGSRLIPSLNLTYYFVKWKEYDNSQRTWVKGDSTFMRDYMTKRMRISLIDDHNQRVPKVLIDEVNCSKPSSVINVPSTSKISDCVIGSLPQIVLMKTVVVLNLRGGLGIKKLTTTTVLTNEKLDCFIGAKYYEEHDEIFLLAKLSHSQGLAMISCTDAVKEFPQEVIKFFEDRTIRKIKNF
ncbi:hypothetical protein ACOME3_008415 [Neoechinorhynchus agilis]